MNQPENVISISTPLEIPSRAPIGSVDQPETAIAATEMIESMTPHAVERTVMQRLRAHPSLTFTRLSVHQCSHDSVCLEGFLESNDDNIDLCDVVRGIHGINSVVNRVMTAHPERPVPKKG